MKICIFGQMQNGKSTLAKMLCKHINDSIRMQMTKLQLTHTFQIGAFAKAIKDIVACKFDIPIAEIELWKNKDELYPGWTKPMRLVLQNESQSGRDVDPLVWVKKVLKYKYPLIIEDGRFQNEADAIYASNGYNILIYRPGYVTGSTHPSEAYIGSLIPLLSTVSFVKGGDVTTGQIPDGSPLRLFNHLVCNEEGLQELEATAVEVTAHILNYMVTHDMG